MASLLDRLSLRGRADDGTRLSGGWFAAAAAVAVSLVGLTTLGLGVVVVQTLDPEGGLPVGSSAALAGRLWLLAQGGGLELASGPVLLAPLVLTAGIAWGLARAARWVTSTTGAGGAVPVARLTGVLVGTHTLLTLLLGVALDGPDAGVALLRTGAAAALLALLAAGWGSAHEAGLVDAVLDRSPSGTRPVLRGILAGLLTALALCTAVVAAALAADAAGVAALSGSLGGSAAGVVGLLSLSVLLLPNAAAAVLGLAAGPGFVVGSGTFVSVHGVALGPVPALPLLAALPDTQAVPLLAFVSQVVPALAGLVAGTAVGRRLAADAGGSVVAGLLGIVSGIGLGAAGAALVWVAGGTLGDAGLATVGAPPLDTGIALAMQAGPAAALAAAVTRWRSR